MDRDVGIKIAAASLLLACTFGIAIVVLKRLNSLISVSMRIREPTWYEKLLRHPAFYLSLCAATVVAVIAWQVRKRRVKLGAIVVADHDVSPWTYWSLICGEMAALALLIHLAIYVAIGD